MLEEDFRDLCEVLEYSCDGTFESDISDWSDDDRRLYYGFGNLYESTFESEGVL